METAPSVDVAGAIRQSTQLRRISDLVKQGYRGVRVLDQARIAGLIHEAVESSWSRLRLEERRSVERDAKAEFLRLMDEHRRVVQSSEDLVAQREELERTIQDLRGVVTEEKGRAADAASFELSPQALAVLERRLRNTLDDSMAEARRTQLAMVGTSSIGFMKSLEARLREMLQGIIEGERERVKAARDAVHSREIDILERRIQKLTQGLEQTERALVSLRERGEEDPGVASIYRQVQGLSTTASDFARRREMLKDIFQQNLQLQMSRAEARDLKTA
ncbi:MAG: hypothetical protein HY722_16110 [Planctomycetes bacterium]|nr:hypothetical protein [Planctomycetota bacterium]